MAKASEIKLIIGLGNPGAEYDNTRHNIGFEVLDLLAKDFGFNFTKEKKFEAEFCSGDISLDYTISKKVKVPYEEPITKTIKEEIKDEEGNISTIEKQVAATKIIYKKETKSEDKSAQFKLLLAKPHTYMNGSGRAIVKIMRFYKIKLENLLIVQDDVTIDTGKLRLAFNRGAGGQHGIEDTIEKLGGNKAFHRLKFGVGPDPGGDTRSNYVLSTFPKAQAELLEETKNQALLILKAWLVDEDYQQLEFSKS